MTGDDAELVSLIDNQLDEEVKGRLLARLEEDERLRTRYEALRNTGILIAGSLNVLLENAPLPRLRASFLRGVPLARAAGRSPALLFAISRPDLPSACWRRARRHGRV
jgi:anti-sigma factor RsiW